MAWHKFHQERAALQRFCQHWSDRTSGEATQSGDRKFHLCLFLLAFRDHWAQGKQRDRRKKRDRTQDEQSCSTSRQPRLPDSDLSSPSQFCNRRSAFSWWMLQRATTGRQLTAHKPSQNHARAPPAKELGKGWRFFPTYAGVQTSTVLRHSLLIRVTPDVRFDACRAAHWCRAAAPDDRPDQALWRFPRQ